MSRKLIAGIGLGLGISAILYALLIYYQKRPSPSYPYTPFSYPAYDDEIKDILIYLEKDPEKGKEKFNKLSKRVHGGKQWVLLRMAAFANENKEYTSLRLKDKPVFRLTAEKEKTQDPKFRLTITVLNPGNTSIHVPQVPTVVELVAADGKGGSKVIPVNRSKFGNPKESEVLTLQAKSFWGITLVFPFEGLTKGKWEIKMRITYSKENMNGLNVLQGIFTSNQISVVL